MNTTVPGGWVEHNWKQLYIQIAYICAAVAYTFVVTALLAKGLDMIPLLRLRSTAEDEALGMDDVQVSLSKYLHPTFSGIPGSLTPFIFRSVNSRMITSKYAVTIRIGPPPTMEPPLLLPRLPEIATAGLTFQLRPRALMLTGTVLLTVVLTVLCPPSRKNLEKSRKPTLSPHEHINTPSTANSKNMRLGFFFRIC